MTFAAPFVYEFLDELQSEGEAAIEALCDEYPITEGEAAVILANWKMRQQLPYFDDTAELEDL